MYRGIIYKYTNKVNGKVYIGQTINEYMRRASFKRGYHQGKFCNAIKKYGQENFEYTIIFEVILNNKDTLLSTLNTMEITYIQLYHSIDKGYNLSEGGNNASHLHTPEVYHKIGTSLHEGYSSGRIINHNKGKMMTDEQRIKISKANKGQISHTKGIHFDSSEKDRRYKATSTPIYAYNLDGSLYKEYKSRTECFKEFPNHNGIRKAIETGIPYKDKIFKSDSSNLQPSTKLTVYCYNLDFTLYKIYNSKKECYKEFPRDGVDIAVKNNTEYRNKFFRLNPIK